MKDTLLIVDDEPLILSSLLRSLQNKRYEIIATQSGEDALSIMRNQNINVVISDQSMNGIQGIEFLLLAKKYRPQTVRILLTGHADMELAVEAVNKGEVFRFLTKPWDDVELKEAVDSAFEKNRFDQLSLQQAT
jgi:DNA-binding NtrC family response regulator